MWSKPLAFAVLTAGCMAAAAGGAYVAMRQDAAEMLPVATAAAPGSGEADAAGGGTNAAGEPVTLEIEPAAPAAEAPAAPRVAAQPQPRRSAETRAPRRRAQTPAANRSERAEASAPAGEAAAPASIERTPLPEPVPIPEPAQPRYLEISVPAETVIGVRVDTTVTSERAKVEDRVEGRVTRDVTVDDRVAIPAGTRLVGAVTMVERGGKFRERAQIAVRFHTAMLPDGSSAPISTTAIVREGDSPSKESAAKVGGSAVGGAIIGAILGGAKGAVIGGTAGAGAGSAIVAAGGRNPATLPAGTQVSVKLMSEVSISVER